MIDSRHRTKLLSVIIPVKNGANTIDACLRSLAALPSALYAFEVIVVDNGSTDGTVEIAASYSAHLAIRVLSLPVGHISAVRNLGAAAAGGEIFAFLDADCVVNKEWFAAIASFPWAEDTGAIGAFFRPPDSVGWVSRVWCRFEGAGKRGPVRLLPSGNLVVRRTTFERLKGFNEALETNEDGELCRRLTTQSFRLEAVPSMEIVHLGAPGSLCALYRREVWHGRDVLRVFIERRANANALLFASHVLLCCVAFIGAAAWWLRTGAIVPVALAVVLLGSASAVISIRAIRRSRCWADLAGLTLLVTIYGVARSVALLRSAALQLRSAQSHSPGLCIMLMQRGRVRSK